MERIPLRLERISKSYGGKKVLDGIDLTLREDETLCILGPTGCGKTTILRIIAGLEMPTAGRVIIGGKVASGEGEHMPPNMRGIGMVFQDAALWPHMTVEENIRFCMKASEEYYGRLVASLGLGELMGRMPSTLSGGQKQCVAIARALAQKPAILLLDEPAANLDWRLKRELFDVIAGLRAEFGVSAVFVTHDMVEPFYIADKIAILKDGVIEEQGKPADVLGNPSSMYVAEYLGRNTADHGGGNIHI